jgi:hypothetical protein
MRRTFEAEGTEFLSPARENGGEADRTSLREGAMSVKRIPLGHVGLEVEKLGWFTLGKVRCLWLGARAGGEHGTPKANQHRERWRLVRACGGNRPQWTEPRVLGSAGIPACNEGFSAKRSSNDGTQAGAVNSTLQLT